MPPLFLPEGSHETVKSELHIFDRPEYQVSQLRGDWVEYKAKDCTGIDTVTPIQIDVPAAEGVYTDLANSYITLAFTVITGTNEAPVTLAETAKVAPINLALASFFKDVCLTVNNIKVEGDSQLYAYKAYLYNLLAASVVCKKHQLAASGWMTDTAAQFDLEGNEGYVARKKWTATVKNATTSTVCNLAGPLYLDVAIQKQYLTDKMNLSFKFNRHSHTFALQSFDVAATAATYRIRFISMALWLRRVQVSPSVIMGHLKGFQSQNAIWKYPAIKVITSHHAKDITNISIPNATPGLYPKCIFVAMVNASSYNGGIAKNPFNFNHYNVKSVGFMMNGQYAAQTPYTPNFGSQDVLREYINLFLATGQFGINEDDNGILIGDYIGGNSIFAFTFAPDLSLTGFAQPIRMINIRLDIDFKVPLPSNIVLMLFCLCDTLFEFTGNGLVILDNTQLPN